VLQQLWIGGMRARALIGGRRFATLGATQWQRRALASAEKDSVAVVTGSTSGIGLGIALQLAKAGHRVVLNGFGDSKAAFDAVAEAAYSKKKVLYSDANLSDYHGCERLIKEAVEGFGAPVSVLVNNAGVQHVSPVVSFPTDKWNQILAINLSAAFHCSRLVIPKMKEKGYGRIINIASVHGLVASTDKAAYVAAKHGIMGLTKVIALETAGTGTTCTAICPGWVRTPLVEAQIRQRAEKSGRTFEDETKALISEKMPSAGFVEVDHIAQTVMFLLSDAASQITGQPIVMDGGWVSQ